MSQIVPPFPVVQAQEPPIEVIIKNCQVQVARVGQQVILRFHVPGAGVTYGIPMDNNGLETLISHLKGDNLVIAPKLPSNGR